MNQDKRVLVVGAAGAAGMLCLLLLVLGVVPGISTADEPNPSPPAPKEECIRTPYFYANDAPEGSNRFGPELADPSLEAGEARFDLKLRSDPAFAAVWERVILHPDWVNTPPEWYEARAMEFLGNEDLWCEQVGVIYDAIDTMATEDRSERYETLLMVPRGMGVPAIRKTERPVPMEHVLVFHLKDGRTEFARYVCDLQPARPEIPGVPPVSTPVPPAPPLPPGVTIPPVAPPPPPPTQPPTTRPPGTTTTTRPTTTTQSTTTTTRPTTTTTGKDHEDSEVSDDPNDPNEPTRPNTPEPTRPPEVSTTTTQPRVPTPTTAAPPAPAPTTSTPAPPPTTGCQDPQGMGLCDP